jgi:hypothetical protein
MTYKMLLENNIDVKSKLYIFVASEEERELYKHSLSDADYNEIIVTELGGNKAIEHAVNFFNQGEFIVFMDDDLEYFYEFAGIPSKDTFVKPSFNLERYIIDAFNSFNETINIFSFSFMTNEFYIKEKPFKEFRPFAVAGSFFGVRNSDLVITDHAHVDDIHRSCKYIRDFGGGLLFNWVGFKTNTGFNDGGMQISGDRGSSETRLSYMKEMAEKVYSIPYVNMFTKPPSLLKHTMCWELRLKSITSINKIRPVTRISWSSYFQQDPDIINTPFNIENFI